MPSQSEAGREVVVGLSGGVDSAVAAFLLKEQGACVTGVFMRNWDDNDPVCPADSDFEDVRSVCERLDIPYYSINFEEEYMDRVFSRFIDAYERGLTPNPDVLCNREIKFAAFLDFALAAGAEYLATGHYARKRTDSYGTSYLLRGADPDKDQSYFLCLLTQNQLKNALFPIGDMNKTEVRSLARKAGLRIADKKDSTGICFIGERKFRDFLSKYVRAVPGEIHTIDGSVIGTHRGAQLYTLGQRRGLGLGGKSGAEDGRWFVIGRDIVNNVIVVSQSEEPLLCREIEVADISFISGVPAERFSCTAKVRYRQPDQKAFVEKTGSNTMLVSFESPQRAVSPGQYCVLYDGEVCLGGGVITHAGSTIV